MEYEDTITIATPEGVELEYTLAGAASRFIAELIDVLLRLVVLGALVAALALVSAGTAVVIVASIASFLAWFAYDVIFEVWGAGRTPGKRWSGLRVVDAHGQPVGLGASAVRTLLRIVDQWSTLAVVGTACITLTRRNQRLGDLAAGTIVIRDRHAEVSVPDTQAAAVSAYGLDVTRIGPSDVATIRDFLGRRDALEAAARSRVALLLADQFTQRIGGVSPGSIESERLLEMIVAAKSTPNPERV